LSTILPLAVQGPELVISADLKVSAIHWDLGHAKLVCPYGDAQTNWMGQEAAGDPNCR